MSFGESDDNASRRDQRAEDIKENTCRGIREQELDPLEKRGDRLKKVTSA